MTAIANAIRSLLGTSGAYTLDTMATAISGITKKTAQTYTPTTSDQTIASGQYLNGAQTIKGDANLISENIKSGVSIFGVSGGLNYQVLDITLASDTTNKASSLANISGTDAFTHRADTYMSARLFPLFSFTEDGMLQFTTNNQYNGITANSTGCRRLSGTEAQVSTSGSLTSSVTPSNNGQITIDASGNLRIGCSSTVPLKAGTWRIIFTW